MNGNICIIELISDIQNPGSESMHICDSNVDYEGFGMCHRTVGVIKINNLNLRTHIFKVVSNKFLCIKIVEFNNTWINY